MAKLDITLSEVFEAPQIDSSLSLEQVGEFIVYRSIPPQINKETCFDETGVECAVNHRHCFSRDKTEVLAVVSQAASLCATLAARFAEKVFRVILSFNQDGEATTRFHQLRTGQEWLNVMDLEGFAEEGMLVIAVGEVQPLSPSRSV